MLYGVLVLCAFKIMCCVGVILCDFKFICYVLLLFYDAEIDVDKFNLPTNYESSRLFRKKIAGASTKRSYGKM